MTQTGERRDRNKQIAIWVCGALLLALVARGAAAVAPALAALDRATALYRQGRLQDALRAFREIAATSADRPVAAEARHNACALANDLGDYRAALPDCREALRLRRAEGDAVSIGQALNNLGLALEMQGSTAEAEGCYREALALNRRRGDALGEAINLGNLGALAASTGRYSEALALHTAAADLAAHHQAEPWAAEQLRIAHINQGTVLGKLGAYREALDLYRGVLATAIAPRDRAALLVNTGVLDRNLGDPVRAAEAFREAITIYGKVGDTASLSNAWLNLGLAEHRNLAQPEAAERSFREALRLALESGDRTEEVQDLFYLGRLLTDAVKAPLEPHPPNPPLPSPPHPPGEGGMRKGVGAGAPLPVGGRAMGEGTGVRSRLDEAEALFRRGLTAAEASGATEGTWSCREGLGRVAAARGDPRRALTELTAALAEIERVRSGIARGRRAGYFGSKRSVYAETVAVLADLARREPDKGWGEQALEVVQGAKARDLLDALGGAGHGVSPRTAADLRGRAGDGTVLEYFLGESDLYLWVVRRDGIRMTDLGAHAPILAAAARVHRALARGTAPPAADLAALSRTLLGPAAPLSAGPLRIAADGPLRYLPFELLPDPAAEQSPLVDRLAVVYLPSASMLAAPPPAGSPPALDLAGFGDPVLPRTFLFERFNLGPLPAAAGELAAVVHALGGRRQLFTGAAATERAVRTTVLRGARVLHLATHTVIDERPGHGAAILLTPEGGDDGLLTPEEIAKLDGRAGLTVLAACRTALANEPGGLGETGALASLTGAFLAAGSRGVVATLWDVDDAATAAFMVQLYDRLGRGDPPAEALRRAKLRLRADPRWNRPSLWAGYVLIGDAPPVAAPRRLWVWLLGLLAVLAAGAIGWARRRSLSGS
jgi:tetratricopeptide (TPR) repeat protein